MAQLPASLRVPRSPAVFVGREADLARALDVLTRSGAVILTGVGGLGKTSLACRVVEELGGAEDAVFVDLAPGASLVLEVGRALARGEGFATADWSTFAHDPAAGLEAVLDLAEAASRLVVVDDLHLAADGAEAALHRLTRLCRRSRWVVTSRRAPEWPGSEEQTVPLDPLAVDDVERLLAACAPHVADGERRAIARAAGGSPWTARSRLRGGASGDAATAGLPERERELLALLAALTTPVPASILRDHAGADDAALEVLRRHGLLGPGRDPVRLHDVARHQLEAATLPAPPAAHLAAVAAALCTSGAPELELEGVALLRRHRGDPALVAASCARVTGWIEAGLAERALAVLDGADEPPILAARLACASAVGSDEALAWAARVPEPSHLVAKLWWAAAHERAGHLALAARAARDVREAAADADLAARAALIEADALRMGGFTAEAEAALAAATPADRGLRLLVDARRAATLLLLGNTEAALVDARRALQAADALPPGPRLEVATTVQTLLNVLGHLAEARAITRRIELERVRAPFVSRQQMALRCIDAIESGELSEGRRWLDRMGDARGARLRVHVLLDELRWRGAVGRFEGFEEILAELSDLCEASGNAEDLAWARVSEAFFGLVLGSTTISPWPAHLPPPRPALATAMEACQRMVRRRAGASAAPSDAVRPEVDIAIFVQRDASEAQLLAGDPGSARRTLADALEHARRYGFHLHAADLLAFGIDAHVGDPRGDEASRRAARRFARDLGALAAQMGSDRYALEAELGSLLAVGGPAPRGRLEAIAASAAVSPIAARRARGALGDVAGLDALDRLVLRGVHGAARSDAPFASGPPETPGWRFDPAARRVELPARIIDLQRHGLLVRLLATLAARGDDGATKEELSMAVWDLRDYHPLRDDKRLQVAVRRLRVMLEDDAERPQRVVTTDHGYAVRGLTRPAI